MTRPDAASIKAAAAGRWQSLFATLAGVDPSILDGKNHPCPKCGGKDRFRLIDKERGACLCNKCFRSKAEGGNGGDGISSLEWLLEKPFKDVKELLLRHLGLNGMDPPRREKQERKEEKEPSPGKIQEPEKEVARWIYVDENGKPHHLVKRFETPSGEKRFQIFKADGTALPKAPAKGEPNPPERRYLPLHLHDLFEADRGSLVLVVEGEKCCDEATRLGFLATTAPLGAGKWHLLHTESLECFRDQDILILPDLDQPGKDHGEDVARSLYQIAETVKILNLPGLPDAGDLVDWVAARDAKTNEEIREEIFAIAEATPVVTLEDLDEKSEGPSTAGAGLALAQALRVIDVATAKARRGDRAAAEAPRTIEALRALRGHNPRMYDGAIKCFVHDCGCSRARLVALVENAGPGGAVDGGGRGDAMSQDWDGQEKLTIEPIMVRLSDVKPEALRWLWPSRIPLGKVSVLVGNPGLGKSLVTVDMAARVSAGKAWPDSPGVSQEARGVVFLSAEDDIADTIRPRLDAAGADVSRVHVMTGVLRSLETGTNREDFVSLAVDLQALEKAIDLANPCALVVIDPVTAYLGKKDSNDNGEMRGLLAQLAALAASRKVAIVCVSHIRKAAGPAVHRTVGSLAFVAAPRAVWGVGKHPKNRDSRVMLPLKANLAADGGSGLAFCIVGGLGGHPVLSWSPEPVDIDPEEVFGDRCGASQGRRGVAREKAEDFLSEALSGGSREAGEVQREADAAGLSESSIDRASITLGLIKEKPGGPGTPWIWSLPKAAPPDTHDALTPLTPYGGNCTPSKASDREVTPLNGTGREPVDEPPEEDLW